ncbi:pilus assembly protein [Bacillus shivajii]|uniref:TadE/TadG family type IV pilus assembly protein n=1 Tax=Bacillus shivajii TaxID=1983719 RepID=UPI001CFA4ED6|nr:TadE/TadG family type IV pilus assembly protein [Bacillus shivajii]UCZ53145.1 pilus assembly protein [Bacillus shivajii]
MLRNEKGQSLVEMALIVPILLILIVGIFDIGRMLYSYSTLHFTAQETVRLGGFGRADADIIQFAKNNYHAGNSSQLTVSVSPSQELRRSGDYVTVTLQYPVEPFTPFVNILFSEPIHLKAESTIRVE